MYFVDTHSHIYTNAFDQDRSDVIERSRKAGVSHIILPNIDGNSIESLLAVSDQYKGYCFPLMGLHPTSVKENYQEELALIERALVEKHFWGVGEIGIDLYWDKTFIKQQKEAFRYQVNLAKKLNLPIVIHTRNAFDEIFEILDSENDEWLRGIFHSFSGTYTQYKKILEYKGFLIGIGGVVTYKNGGLDKIVQQMNIEHIVLETDSPYLSPVPFRGKRNESSYIVTIANKIAEILNLPIQQVAEITTRNALSLFKLEKKL